MRVNAEHIAHRQAYDMPESKFTNDQKVIALRRELAFRRTVFPKRVRNGSMLKAEAEKQIAIVEEMIEDYTRLAQQAHEQLELGGD